PRRSSDLNPCSTPSRNAREMQRERWVCRMDQSTRSFGLTGMECRHWKLQPGRSAVSAPEPCDFPLTGQVNQSASKNCLLVTRWNSRDGIHHVNELPPAS